MKSALGLLACLLLVVLFSRTQERLSYQDGLAYDASAYWHQARLVQNDRPIQNWAPFVYRLGAPYVVGRIYPPSARWIESEAPALKAALVTAGPVASGDLDPDDLLDGFLWLGLLSGALTLVLLYGIFRAYGMPRHIAFGLLAVYIANPHSPLRFPLFYPAYSDPLALTFVWALFWLYKRYPQPKVLTTAALCALGFLGALVREIVLLVPLLFLGTYVLRGCLRDQRFQGRALLAYTLPLVATMIGLWATRQMVEALPVENPSRAYTTLGHMQMILQRNLDHPSILALCLLTSIGPFVLWIAGGLLTKELRSFLRQHLELVVFLPGMLALAAVGGYHTDRFVFWSLPGYLILLGTMLNRRIALPHIRSLRYAFVGLLLVATVLTYRVLHPIPDATNNTLLVPQTPERLWFAAYGESTTWGQLTASAMEPWSRMILLTQFATLGLALAAIRYTNRLIHRETPSPGVAQNANEPLEVSAGLQPSTRR